MRVVGGDLSFDIGGCCVYDVCDCLWWCFGYWFVGLAYVVCVVIWTLITVISCWGGVYYA